MHSDTVSSLNNLEVFYYKRGRFAEAESLATAFLLPEQLEKNGTFKEVQPGDASRSRKGEGTVAEFRVDCKLNRKGVR